MSNAGADSPSPEGTPANGHMRPKWQFELDDESSRGRGSWSNGCWSRVRQFVARPSIAHRGDQYAYDYHATGTDEEQDASTGDVPLRSPRRRPFQRLVDRLRTFVWRLPFRILMFFGIIHIILAIYGGKSLFWDTKVYSPTLPNLPNSKGLVDYPTDVTRDVLPIPVHSHNDYWRRVPLFDALHWGCASVEADVWGYDDQEELLVGHTSTSLSPTRTLRSLYVQPLVDLLDQMNSKTQFSTSSSNGVFDTDASQTLVLLIDFKTNGHELYPRVYSELEPLRSKGYLSHWDGQDFISRAITIVGTGNAPFDLITANTTYRDIFFDAPLDELYLAPNDTHPETAPAKKPANSSGQGKTGTEHLPPIAFNTSNSYYASVSMFAALGLPWTGSLNAHQMDLLRGQIRGAHRQGLKVRYWETPAWPTSLRNKIWRILWEEGADILNVDDLAAVATAEWWDGNGVGHAWLDA